MGNRLTGFYNLANFISKPQGKLKFYTIRLLSVIYITLWVESVKWYAHITYNRCDSPHFTGCIQFHSTTQT